MKISVLLLFTLLTLQSWAQTPAINSIETLKSFMQVGQKNGYFPRTLPIGLPMSQNKLMEVDLDFRRVVHWNINTRCPDKEDQIILALGSKNHAIVCNRGDSAGILGSGDDWIKDATGNDIYYPGPGNDIVDVGSGNDVLIFEEGWGHDTVTMDSHTVDTTKILGYDGSYPWTYSDFIIFGTSIKRSDIVWIDSMLYNLKTGDSIAMNTKNVNILFASEKSQSTVDIPTRQMLQLSDLGGESMVSSDDLLYIANGNNGIQVVDVKDPQMLMLLSTLVLPGRAMSMVLKDKIAYVAQGDFYLEGKRGWVSIVDLHDPSQPKVLSTLKFGNTIKQVVLQDNILYVPSTHYWLEDKRDLYIYDVTKKEKPKLRSRLSTKEYISSMVSFNAHLYYTNHYNYLRAFDISDAIAPKPVSITGVKDIRGEKLVVDDDLLFITRKEHRITLYKGTHHGGLQYQCDFQTVNEPSGHINSIVISDDLLYTAESKFGITVNSISECRRKAYLPLENGEKPWPARLIKVKKNLVSFSEGREAQIYTYKNGNLYHIHTPSTQTEKKTSVVLSQDQLQTALFQAALHGNSAEVKRLIGLGANPNVKGHERNTPVEIASRVGAVGALEELLKGGGKPSKSAMLLAALTEKEVAMKLLERYGVPVTVKDKGGCSTLHYIAQDGSLEMVKYLLKKGVPYNSTCRKGETPLTWANYGNNCVVIDYLETLYSKNYQHQHNLECTKRRVEKERLRALQLLEEAKKKAYTKVVDGKSFAYQPIKIKFKAKQKRGQLNIKTMIANPMYSKELAEKRGQPAHFLMHMTVSVKDKLLMDATLSPYLSQNPFFKAKFTYKEKLDTSPVIAVRDNVKFNAKAKVSRMHKIKRDPFSYKVEGSHDYRVLKPAVWSAIGIDDAIRAFYGAVSFQESDFKIVTPKVAENGGSIPVHIESKLVLESMLVLATGNHDSAVIAYHIPFGQKPNYDFRIKVRENGTQQIVVVAKGRDGKYYKSNHYYELPGPPTCDGS